MLDLMRFKLLSFRYTWELSAALATEMLEFS